MFGRSRVRVFESIKHIAVTAHGKVIHSVFNKLKFFLAMPIPETVTVP